MDDERGAKVIVGGSLLALVGMIALWVIGEIETAKLPTRVITCRILQESVGDEDNPTWWRTDRCGVLYGPGLVDGLFNARPGKAIQDLDEGHTYRIRVRDVEAPLATRTRVVAVEGEVP